MYPHEISDAFKNDSFVVADEVRESRFFCSFYLNLKILSKNMEA